VLKSPVLAGGVFLRLAPLALSIVPHGFPSLSALSLSADSGAQAVSEYQVLRKLALRSHQKGARCVWARLCRSGVGGGGDAGVVLSHPKQITYLIF
jgi:hypothetical protein